MSMCQTGSGRSVMRSSRRRSSSVKRAILGILALFVCRLVFLQFWYASSLEYGDSSALQSHPIPPNVPPILPKHEQEVDTTTGEIQETLQQLEDTNLRYYVYDHPDLLQTSVIEKLLRREIPVDHYKIIINSHLLAVTEVEIIQTFQNHSLRTWNPEEASMFYIPIPVAAIFCLQWKEASQLYQHVFQVLFEEMKVHMGQRYRPHLLVSMELLLFNRRHTKHSRRAGMLNIYPRLQNVTVAHMHDMEEMHKALQRGLLDGHDFLPFFQKTQAFVRSGFSIALQPGFDFPFRQASYEAFQQSTYYVFYHTRENPSTFNSTRFRHAPVVALQNHTAASSLHPSKPISIGFNIDPQAWKEHYVDSQFCLVIRGDTPESHSHLRSIKAGCLPVMVTNYGQYSTPFLKDFLNWKDFCLFLDEDAFIQDPAREIRSLQFLPEDTIREKMQHLRLVQRLILPDHPHSLFVPALLKQTILQDRRRIQKQNITNVKEFFSRSEFS